MTITGEAESPQLAEVERRARRRWKVMLFALVAVGAAGGVVGGVVGSHGHRHRTAVRHHTSHLGVIVAGIVLVVIVAAEVVFFVRMSRKHQGMFGPQLIMGLPFRQRRQVMKAVRRGEPLAEPTLRAIGVSVAARLVRFAKLALWAAGLLILAGAVNAGMPDRPLVLRMLFGAEALLVIPFGLLQRRNITGARRYLMATGEPIPGE